MDTLPPEVLTQIFKFLDNDSVWSAMRVCRRFASSIASSSRLLNSFQLKIDRNLLETQPFLTLPTVTIKSVLIKDIQLCLPSDYSHNNCGNSEEDQEIIDRKLVFMRTIEKYENSIVKLTIAKVDMLSEDFRSFFANLTNLRHFEVVDLKLVKHDQDIGPFNFPQLESVAFTLENLARHNLETYYDFFTFNRTVRSVKISCPDQSLFSWRPFDDFLESLPSFNHLILDGRGTASYIEQTSLDLRLEKLEVPSLSAQWSDSDLRHHFLTSQLGTLRALRLKTLPLDFMGNVVLKFILEVMELDEFYYGDLPLVMNGRRQEIEEIRFCENNVLAGVELLRQFRSIRKLRHELNSSRGSTPLITQIIAPHANLFSNLQELTITDRSGRHEEFSNFVDLYKMCRNVTRLSVESTWRELSQGLRTILPEMTQLREIRLESDDYDISGRLRAICGCCEGLQVLRVKVEHVEIAKVVFRNTPGVAVCHS